MNQDDILEREEDGTSPLPSTRRQSFYLYGKESAFLLLICSLLCSVSFVPSVVWLFAMNYVKTSCLAQMEMANEDASSYLLSHTMTVYAVLIPLLMLFFFVLSGCFSVVRRICFAQNCRISHFFIGIKENGVRFLLFGFLFGVALFFLCFNSVLPSTVSTEVSVFAKVASWAVFILVCMVVLFSAMQTVVYQVSIRQMFQNAFTLSLMRLPMNMLILVSVAVLPVMVLLLPFPFQLLGLSVIGLFYPGYGTLFLGCYCNSVFDKSINKKLGNTFVGRGLNTEKH